MSDWSEGNWSGYDGYDGSSGYFEDTYTSPYDDFLWSIGIDPSTATGPGGTTPSNDQILQQIGASNSNSFLGLLGRLVGGSTALGNTGALVGAAGLGSLLNRISGTGQTGPAGYRGGIPEYAATRTQTPMAQQRPAGYRPGQGGITYFNPIEYTYQGRDISPPSTPAPAPAPTPTNTLPTYVEPPSGMRAGGIAGLAPKGRFLQGEGDGTSDSIKAQFTESGAPAALADGEFVFDARTVSEIGNGSSEAGARKLYAVMDRVHKDRKTAKRGKPSGADRHLKTLLA